MTDRPIRDYSLGCWWVAAGWLLFIACLAAKLDGLVGWSWWWVTAPLWGPVLLLIAVVIGVEMILGRKN